MDRRTRGQGEARGASARRIILVVASVVLVAAVLLVRQLRQQPAAPSPAPTTSSETATPTIPERPALPGDEPTGGTPIVSETTVDGTRIRDHRTGAGTSPVQPRTPDRGTSARRVPAELIHSINGKLAVTLAECTGSIPTEARSPRSRIGGTIQIDIAAGILQVTEANVQLLNVEGESARTVKQCLEQKWIGQSTPASGAEDITRHPITVSFALPAV